MTHFKVALLYDTSIIYNKSSNIQILCIFDDYLCSELKNNFYNYKPEAYENPFFNQV